MRVMFYLATVFTVRVAVSTKDKIFQSDKSDRLVSLIKKGELD